MIFISYSLKDEGAYTSLCLALEAANLTYWKNNLKAGAPLKDQLRDAISNCNVCIFVATRSSVTSQWCLNEIGAFWGAGKRIILYAANAEIETKLPPLFKGDYWTADAREVIRQVREELEGLEKRESSKGVSAAQNNSLRRGVDYVNRALRSVSTYPVLEELEEHIGGLQGIADASGYDGENARSLLSEVDHLYGEMGGLWRLSQGDAASQLLLKKIQSDLDILQRKLRADEELKPCKAKLLKMVFGDERLLRILLEEFAGPAGVLRVSGATLKKVFQEEKGKQIARVEGALARAGYRTDLSTDEEHGIWEIDAVATGGTRVTINLEFTSQPEFQRAVETYKSL
jgi:hypothetical protein